jgi:hypothetical protein
VDGQGQVTANTPGLVYIKGRSGNLSDSAKISVSTTFEGDQLTIATGGTGVVAVFTSLDGGTHFQLAVKDGHGQSLIGATVQYADVGEKALFSVKGPGNGYAPAFLYGTPTGILALGTLLPTSGLPGLTSSGNLQPPPAAISQAGQLDITLPAVSGVELTVIDNGLDIPTFYYDPGPVTLGLDGTFRGRKCITWEQLAQHMEDRLALILPSWADAVVTLSRSDSPSFFDPSPVEGDEDVFFPAQGVVQGLTGEDLLAEKIALLGAMLHESATGRRIEVTWDFGEGGADIRQALGWYLVRTNDRYCGGDVPENLTALTPTLTGEPDTQVQRPRAPGATPFLESRWSSPSPAPTRARWRAARWR